MSPVTILAVRFVVVLVGIAVLWVVMTRRLPATWAAIGWGVLAFPLSQVARYALVIPVNLLLTQVMGPAAAVATTVVLVLTSGLFEESARWIVLRYWATRVRSWENGVAFGLGHGGIEAILVMGLATVNGIILLTTADTVRASIEAATPDQLAAFDAQLASLQSLTIGAAGLGLYERVLALVVHVALTLIVLRGVRTGRGGWRWWLAAVVLHCAVNGIAVAVMSAAGAIAAEVVLTVLALSLLWAVLRGPVSRPHFTSHSPD